MKRPSLKEQISEITSEFSTMSNLPINEKIPTQKGAEVFMIVEGQETHIGHNLIPNTASILLAWLASNSNAPNGGSNGGFSFMAVGTGNAEWTLLQPPAPTIQQTELNNEIARVSIETVNFIDTDGTITTSPTNVVDFIATFPAGTGTGPLMELGVFGGDATGSTDTGMLVSVINFPVKSKLAQETISWRFRFLF